MKGIILIIVAVLFTILFLGSEKNTEVKFIEKPEINTSSSLLDRLTDTDRYPGDGLCSDGENLLLDPDCTPSYSDIKCGQIFKQMWFLRFLLIIIIIFLITKNDKSILLIILFITLLFFNGVGSSEQEIEPEKTKEYSCQGIDFFKNAGGCLYSPNPVIGWIVAVVIIGLIFFRKEIIAIKSRF